MEQMLIRGLPVGTKAAIRARAQRHGRSVEAEAREIFAAAVASEPLSLADLLHMPAGVEIEFEPERLNLSAKAAEL